MFIKPYIKETSRVLNIGEKYLLQTLKLSSFSLLFLSFLVVNFFSAKPQYLLVKVTRSFSNKLERIFVELLNVIIESESYLEYQKKISYFLEKLYLKSNGIDKSIRFLRDFFEENIRRSQFIESWYYCQNFETMKLLSINNCNMHDYKKLKEFISFFNKVVYLKEKEDKDNKKVFNIEWPIGKMLPDLKFLKEEQKIINEIRVFFDSKFFFNTSRRSILKNSFILLMRNLPMNLIIYFSLCIPIINFSKNLTKIVKEKQNVILNEIPIEVINQYRNKYTLEKVGLFFSKEQQEEIYFANHILSNFNDFAFCFQGEKGSGKTKTAQYICASNGGGYIVNLSKITLMGNEGINIFYELIKDCMINNKILIIDDSEGVMISRSTLYEKDSENKQYEENTKTIVVALLSALSFHKFKCIFITNSTQEIDEAFERRVYVLRFPRSHKDSFEKIVDQKFKYLPCQSFKNKIKEDFLNRISYRNIELLSTLGKEGIITRNQVYRIFKNAAFFEYQNEIALRCQNADVGSDI